MIFCIRYLLLLYFFCIGNCFSDAISPGYDGFSSTVVGESDSLQKSDSSDDSMDILLWGRTLDLEGSNASDAFELFNDWAERVKVSTGITPRDAVNISNRKEMYALRKFLSKFITYKKPKKESSGANQLERKYSYYLYLEGLAEKLNDKGLSSQYLTVKQLIEFQSQDRSNKHNDSVDTLNIRDIFYALEQSIEQLGGQSQAPFLRRIRAKFFTLVETAVRAHAESSTDSNASYLLRKWEKLRSNNESIKVLRFPWSEIASGQPRLKRFRSVFKYVMTLPSYLQLTYRQFFSVETMMWFGEHEQMLLALDQLDKYHGEINLDELEKSQSSGTGRLRISELVRFTRTQPQFRELAGVLYNRYLDSLKRQDFVKKELIAMRDRVLDVMKIPRIKNLITEFNHRELQKVIDNFDQKVDLGSLIKPLLVIEQAEGVDVSDAYKDGFMTSTGLNYNHVIKTNGDTARLVQLIRKNFPQKSNNPEFMNSTLNKISKELQQKVESESTLSLINSAKYQNLISRILQEPDTASFFVKSSDRLLFKKSFINELLNSDSVKVIKASSENFDRDFSETETQLDKIDALAIKVKKTLQNVAFLEKELEDLEQNVSKTVIEDRSQRIQSWRELLKNERTKVLKAVKDLKSEQTKFDLVRSRLAQIVGLSDKEIKSNPIKLNQALESYLKSFALDDQNIQRIPTQLVSLLVELRQRAAVISNLKVSISKSNKEVLHIGQKIKSMTNIIQGELLDLIENRKVLEEQHGLVYKRISYLTEDEQNQIQENASMSAEFDEDVANQYAARYLIGFIRKGDTQDTAIENIRFHSFTDSSISFDLTLINTHMNDDWQRTENRQTLTIKVRPKVVKSHSDNFDFQILSLKLKKDGENSIELRTGFAVILDSTLTLLNLMISSLNDTPYENLKFKYFPHLETIRIINGLPTFESFPNFKINLIQLLQGKLYVYGDVSGETLGTILGKNLILGENSRTGFEVQKESTESEYDRDISVSSNLIGEAKIRINQKLINDFYSGIRLGVIQESSNSETSRFFEGLETAKIHFEEANQVSILFEGDFKKISRSTNRFYSLINGIASPYLGIKQGLARAGSGFLRFVTFGKINVEVDPKKYQTPSGKFSIFLDGKSKFHGGKTFLDFDTVSLYDPVNKGALQPYLGAGKVIMSVTRAAGWLYDQLVRMIDAIPGVNVKRPQNRLDRVLLTWLAANLAHQIDSQIEDLTIEVTSFNSYNFLIEDFELVEGIDTQITDIKVKNEIIEIVSTARLQQ